MAHAYAVLRELVQRFGEPDSKAARLVRSKNRFEKPSGGGWMDCLINVEVDLPGGGGEPPERYVCEVQIVHRQLLVVRTELGAHHGCMHRARSRTARARSGAAPRTHSAGTAALADRCVARAGTTRIARRSSCSSASVTTSSDRATPTDCACGRCDRCSARVEA